jgi:hypothetical protein
MTVDIGDGDLLDQEVEVIVNAWNRNIIPVVAPAATECLRCRTVALPGHHPCGGMSLFWRSSEKAIWWMRVVRKRGFRSAEERQVFEQLLIGHVSQIVRRDK